jgi:hypothetical protein
MLRQRLADEQKHFICWNPRGRLSWVVRRARSMSFQRIHGPRVQFTPGRSFPASSCLAGQLLPVYDPFLRPFLRPFRLPDLPHACVFTDTPSSRQGARATPPIGRLLLASGEGGGGSSVTCTASDGDGNADFQMQNKSVKIPKNALTGREWCDLPSVT